MNPLSRIGRLFDSWIGMLVISILLASCVVAFMRPRDPKPRFEKTASEAFTLNSGFPRDLDFIRPQEFGVGPWKVGDFAAYRHTYRDPWSETKAEKTKDVRFHIIGELPEKGMTKFWLKETGFAIDRLIPKDVFRLVTVSDLRITPENRYYDYVQNYIPVNDTPSEAPRGLAPAVREVGKDMLQTEAGPLECIHYRVEGRNRFHVEFWINPAVKPMGLVRAKTPDELLELLSFGNDQSLSYPKIIEPVLKGTSRLEHGCTSCHGPNNCHETIFPPR